MAAHKRIISTALRQRNEALQKAQNARNALSKAKWETAQSDRAVRHLERLLTKWQNTAIKYRIAFGVAVLAAVLVAVFK